VVESGTPLANAPLLVKILITTRNVRSFELFTVPFVAIVAASLYKRCADMNLPITAFRTSVQTQLISVQNTMQKYSNMFAEEPLNEFLVLLTRLQAWASECSDAVGLGHILSLVQVQIVLCNQIFIHESSLLQCFAYICERLRFNHTVLPDVLETLFEDKRICPFLFLHGRPQALDDCRKGTERWCDPEGMLGNLKVTTRIFFGRGTPLLTEKIIANDGRVTRAMEKRLDNKTLDEYLTWELHQHNPFDWEVIVIAAVRKMIDTDSDKDIPISKIWLYLRYKVFEVPALETQVLSNFIEAYDRSALRIILE
jgi:hypothetical protein